MFRISRRLLNFSTPTHNQHFLKRSLFWKKEVEDVFNPKKKKKATIIERFFMTVGISVGFVAGSILPFLYTCKTDYKFRSTIEVRFPFVRPYLIKILGPNPYYTPIEEVPEGLTEFIKKTENIQRLQQQMNVIEGTPQK